MFVKKNFSLKDVLAFTWLHMVWLTLWSTLATAIYFFTGFEWLAIPWSALSVIGIAVSFTVGFKNNQSYDRMWEARKVWGAIVNDSRSIASQCNGFISNLFTETPESEMNLQKVRTRILHRHIAWLYMLRGQLLIPTSWEHVSLGMHIGSLNEKRMEKYGTGLVKEFVDKIKMEDFLDAAELSRMSSFKNQATFLIDEQTKDLRNIREANLIDDFRHMEMQALLTNFYGHQGKLERIKKFPLPRQYANMSLIFVGIFIFLIPFSMASVFSEYAAYATWISIPFSALIGWIFISMELMGDYSENPFEGLGNDIPMLSLCRTIEIDLRQMLGEQDIPEPIPAKRGVLM